MEAKVNTEKDEVVDQVMNTKEEAVEEGKNRAIGIGGKSLPRQ